MSAHSHDNMVPPGALVAAAALVLMSLMLVASVRLGLVDAAPTAAVQRADAGAVPTAERMLRFEDQADGKVRISDARDNSSVALIGQEEGSGFIRGVMRGLARERMMHDAGPEAAFRLTLWPDGALSLEDPVTGRIVELGSFGPDNRAAFARLLEPPRLEPRA